MELMLTKGKKKLVKCQNMLDQHVKPNQSFIKYMPLRTKMVKSCEKVTLVQTNFELFCDILILVLHVCLLCMKLPIF
jgi:hypothetical protein